MQILRTQITIMIYDRYSCHDHIFQKNKNFFIKHQVYNSIQFIHANFLSQNLTFDITQCKTRREYN